MVEAEPIKELDINELGRRIRGRRAYLGMSQTDLATRVGLERTSIWAIENGRQGIGLAAAYRLAQALGFSGIDEMIGNE